MQEVGIQRGQWGAVLQTNLLLTDPVKTPNVYNILYPPFFGSHHFLKISVTVQNETHNNVQQAFTIGLVFHCL